MSLFRTLAGAIFDGAAVTKTAGRVFSAIVRTNGQAHGSWDLTLQHEVPTGKAIVRVSAIGAALTSDYVWLDTKTLRVTLRSPAAALTDALFGVTVKRCAAE